MEEVENLIKERKVNFGYDERKLLYCAKNSDNTYNKDFIETAIKIQEAFSEKKASDSSAVNLTNCFSDDKGNVCQDAIQKILDMIKNKDKEDVDNLNSFFYNFIMPGSSEIKCKVLDIINETDTGILSACAKDISEVMYKATTGNKNDALKRLDRIRSINRDFDISEESCLDNIYYLYYTFGKSEEEQILLGNKALDIGLYPKRELVDLFRVKPEKVLKATEVLKKYKFDEVGIQNEDIIDNIIFNKNSKIMKYLEQNYKDFKNYNYVSIQEDVNNSSRYDLKLIDEINNNRLDVIFDKNTQNIISTNRIMKENNGEYIIKTNLIKPKKEIEQHYRIINEYLEYKNETITDRSGKTILNESSVPGQVDMYKIGKDGKIKVLSKAFQDPISGETVIKRKFKSYSGTKTDYKYFRAPNGNDEMSYIIKDKAENELLQLNRKVEYLDKNHSIHTVNNKKYDVVTDGNIVKIKINNEKENLIDLREYVCDLEEDKEIIELLKKFPPDELLNLKNIKNLKFKKGSEITAEFEKKDLFYNTETGKYEYQRLRTINILPEDMNELFLHLHELGHTKVSQLSKEARAEILEVYKKECDLYKKKTMYVDDIEMSYLVDNTGHYNNNNRFNSGALEEALADINAALRCPSTDRRLSVRTIKFMEQFPETIATAAQYLL